MKFTPAYFLKAAFAGLLMLVVASAPSSAADAVVYGAASDTNGEGILLAQATDFSDLDFYPSTKEQRKINENPYLSKSEKVLVRDDGRKEEEDFPFSWTIALRISIPQILGLEVGFDINRWLRVRTGFNYFPSFQLPISKGDLGGTLLYLQLFDWDVIADFYPIPRSGLRVSTSIGYNGNALFFTSEPDIFNTTYTARIFYGQGVMLGLGLGWDFNRYDDPGLIGSIDATLYWVGKMETETIDDSHSFFTDFSNKFISNVSDQLPILQFWANFSGTVGWRF